MAKSAIPSEPSRLTVVSFGRRVYRSGGLESNKDIDTDKTRRVSVVWAGKWDGPRLAGHVPDVSRSETGSHAALDWRRFLAAADSPEELWFANDPPEPVDSLDRLRISSFVRCMFAWGVFALWGWPLAAGLTVLLAAQDGDVKTAAVFATWGVAMVAARVVFGFAIPLEVDDAGISLSCEGVRTRVSAGQIVECMRIGPAFWSKQEYGLALRVRGRVRKWYLLNNDLDGKTAGWLRKNGLLEPESRGKRGRWPG